MTRTSAGALTTTLQCPRRSTTPRVRRRRAASCKRTRTATARRPSHLPVQVVRTGSATACATQKTTTLSARTTAEIAASRRAFRPLIPVGVTTALTQVFPSTRRRRAQRGARLHSQHIGRPRGRRRCRHSVRLLARRHSRPRDRRQRRRRCPGARRCGRPVDRRQSRHPCPEARRRRRLRGR